MNVLIVDDDRFVVAALTQRIDWVNLGFDNVYTAYNVHQAKTIISEHIVHILMSDIDMPQGTGLDLLAWIRSKNQEIQTIFLTNYADFNYAQKAIELKSFEYYLKPIEFDKLTLIIQKAMSQVESIEKSKQAESNAHLWEVNKIKVAEHFWRTYIKQGKNYSYMQLDMQFEHDHLSYTNSDSFVMILFDLFTSTLSEHHEITPCFKDEKNLFLRFKSAFQTCFKDILSPDIDILIESTSIGPQYIAIIRCPRDYYDTLQPNLTASCKQLITLMQSDFNCPLSCVLGIPCTFDTFHNTLHHLHLLAEDMIDCRYQVFSLNHYVPLHADYHVPDLEYLDKQLYGEKPIAFIHMCKEYLNNLAREHTLNRHVICSFQMDIVQLIYSFLNKNGILAHKLLQGKTNEQLFEHSTRSIEDMLMYITFLVHTTLDYIQISSSQKSVATIICSYIDSHYAEDINRSNLAEIVYLDPDYTAHLFKKEIGVSLGNYIIQKRLSVAQDLLIYTDLAVHLIASKVGYGNYSYFTKLFKKENACTPGDYRKSKRLSYNVL